MNLIFLSFRSIGHLLAIFSKNAGQSEMSVPKSQKKFINRPFLIFENFEFELWSNIGMIDKMKPPPRNYWYEIQWYRQWNHLHKIQIWKELCITLGCVCFEVSLKNLLSNRYKMKLWGNKELSLIPESWKRKDYYSYDIYWTPYHDSKYRSIVTIFYWISGIPAASSAS